MSVRGFRVAASLLSLALFVYVPPLFSQQPYDPLEAFNANGFDQNRNYFSGLPIEHIDPMTGNLILTFTDLVLPGNAGLDVKIQRVYNSKIYRNFNSMGDTLGEDSWAGVGWTMHLGRILDPDVTPVVEMSDGSRHPTYLHIDSSGRFITKEYWVYNRNLTVPTLSLTNGVVYKFGAVINGMRHVTEITDPFGNRIVVEYANPTTGDPADGIKKITQYLSSTKTRVVNFTYETTVARKNLKTISYTGEKTYTWTYVHTTVPVQGPLHSLLKEVKPPVGPSWLYQYNETTSPRYELTRATAPGGGYPSYSYSTVQFYNPGSVQIVNSRALTGKQSGGFDIAAGSWTFSFAEGSNKDRSTFTTPCGTIKYHFLGIGNQTFQVEAWQVGLQASKEIRDGTTVLEREEFTWKKGDAISTTPFVTGLRTDADTWVPLLEVRTVTRGTGTFTTTNSYGSTNFNDFGRPNRVAEAGDRSRTTDYTFDYNFSSSLYLKDRIATESITDGTKTLTKSYDYNNTTGFKESETIYGVTTTFSSDAFGNVDRTTDATNKSTDFTYDWGVLKNTITPLYTITRTVVASGLVTSVLRRGFTTTFAYDTLFRITLIDPPVGANFAYSYDNTSGRWMQLTRGTATQRTDLDGFGRPSATSNAVGTKTDMSYDACGRMTYQSYPFEGTANKGTTYQYDVLGRVTRKIHPDLEDIVFAYDVLDVDITNERGYVSRQAWEAYGDPSSALLVGVVDRNTQTWAYDYDVMGNLTLVNPPGSGPNRTWVYNTKNQLTSETHPESGTVTYAYYANGKLQTRTDPEFGATTYSYDNNNRLTYVDFPGTSFTDLDYDASDNRTLLENQAIRSTLTYDGVNRLDVRSDFHKSVAFTFSVDYDYDTRDNLQYVTYPRESGTGPKIQYTYDNGNRITRVAEVGGAARVFAQNILYHPSGGIREYLAGNGYRHQFQYDPDRYWIKDITDSGGPQVVLDLQYDYDPAGNVQSITDARPGMTHDFVYDSLDRLTQAVGPWGTAQYGYDVQGNRMSQTTAGASTTYNYSATTNRLTSATGADADTFGYDANGNLVGRNGATFSYTPENMLATATVGPEITTYRYDGDNLRKQKIGVGSTQYFVHGPANQLMSEFQEPCPGQVRWVRDYIYAGTRLLAALEAPPLNPQVELVSAVSSAGEDAGTAPIGVRVSTSNASPLLCPAGVDYASSDGTARTGTDYLSTAGSLSFAAGTPSGTVQTIPIGLLNDALDEVDETFRLSLSNASGAALGLSEHTVTVLDDDLPPAISVNDVSLAEGDAGAQNVVFTVSLSAPSGLEARVDYATADGSAQAPSDYGTAAGSVVFAPGTTSQTVAVSVVGDARYEPNEEFRLNLLNPVNATIADAEGIGTITNDDPAPSGVPFFTATSTSGQVKLEWVNPAQGPYLSTVIRYRAIAGSSACGFPSESEGELLVSQIGALGAHESFTHVGLLNDNTTYCYSAFVELEPGLFSQRRTSKGRPFDTSGAVKWAYSTGAPSVAPQGLGSGGVYGGSMDAVLHGVKRGELGGDWVSGWKPALLSGPTSARPTVISTALIPGAARVAFVSSLDGYVSAVNADTGGVLWRSAKLADSLRASVAGMFRAFGGAYDYLLIGTQNASGPNRFLALNPTDGTVIGGPFDNGGGANGIGVIGGGASVDYAGKRVFFASRALPGGSVNTVWCLNLTDSGLTFGWAVALGDIDGSPTLNNGRLYVGTNQGMAYALDPNDGRVLWSFPAGEPVQGFLFPDHASEQIYFSTTTKVWGVTFGSSEPNWPPVVLPEPSTAVFLSGMKLVFVGAGDGKLYQLDVTNAGPGVPPEIRSVSLGDGLEAAGIPLIDVQNLLLYVGSESGFVYAVDIPLLQ